MKITLEWIENQEVRSDMAAQVSLHADVFRELLALARRGLGPSPVPNEEHAEQTQET